MILIFLLFFVNFLQNASPDGNFTTRKMMTKAKQRKELVKQCPIIISEDLPYDYKLEYQQKLVVDIKISLFRLVEVNDLEKS